MANTQFVKQIQSNAAGITWKDIFSEYRQPHKKEDMDYLLLAGSSLINYDEATMFQRWRKPWLFWRVLLIGLAAIGALYAAEYIIIAVYGYCGYSAINLLFITVPPMVTPVALMVFFWELNVPRNISIYQLAGCFAGGGLLSFFFTVILNSFFDDMPAYVAPLTEEPAKLLTAILFIQMVAKRSNIKIYGLTGLCIGAAVGAGFGAFESAQYAFNRLQTFFLNTNFGGFVLDRNMVKQVFWDSHLLRGILAVGGHTLYCAPYAAAVALHCKHGKFTLDSLKGNDFLVTFLTSCAVHYLWNGGMDLILIPYKFFENMKMGMVGLYLSYGCLSAVLWISTLRITQTCLRQVTSRPFVTLPDPENPVLLGNHGELVLHVFQENQKPVQYRFSGQRGSVRIGRNPDCAVCLPNASGLSRYHCQFVYSSGTWLVQDERSQHGTCWANGTALQPGQWYPVRDGMCLYLGGKKIAVGVSLPRN